MKATRILFPTDFSHQSDAALEIASRLARASDAELHILHVDDMKDFYAPLAVAGPNVSTADIWDRSKIRERLIQVKPRATGVNYKHHFRGGVAADEIAACARDEDIDLVVMASHGRSGLARLLIGSVAEDVLRRITCPIVIIKVPLDQQELRQTPNERNSTVECAN